MRNINQQGVKHSTLQNMLTMFIVKKNQQIQKKRKKICVKAVFDSVNALVVYNTVQYGINQDNQCRNHSAYNIFHNLILKYYQNISIFKFVIVKTTQDHGKSKKYSIYNIQ